MCIRDRYEGDQLNDELKDIVFPLLGLEDGSYESFAASVSSMMVRSFTPNCSMPSLSTSTPVRVISASTCASGNSISL